MSAIAGHPFEPSRSAVRDLLGAGLLAPSADNQHHVRFAVRADGIALRADPAFLQCDVVHRRLLILLSFGAVVENIRLKLTEQGCSFTPKWFPDPSDPSLLIDLRWSQLESGQDADVLARFIEQRHTNRRFFKGPRLAMAEAATIEAAASRSSGTDLRWCDTPDRRRTLVRMMRRAETARFRSPFLHRELFESIAFEVGWRSTTSERLAPGSLQVERGMRMPFAAMRHWPLMRIGIGLGAHHVLGLRAGDLPARTAPHLGVIGSTLPADAAALAVGAAFQRVWLAAESLGLALQPMVASAILTSDVDPRHGLPSALRATLDQGWRTLIGEAAPFVVFRLGRAERPAVRSGRGAIERYLV